LLAHKPRTELRELALGGVPKRVQYVVAHYEVQNRIAEKLQTLVIELASLLRFVEVGLVGQGFDEQAGPPEPVSEPALNLIQPVCLHERLSRATGEDQAGVDPTEAERVGE